MPLTNAPVMTKAQLQVLHMDMMEEQPGLTLHDAERIDSYVISLYRKVLDIAENSSETVCINKVYTEYMNFYWEHLERIMHSLKLRLPDSKVEAKVLVYDATGSLTTPSDLSFFNTKMNTYIVIDWS